MWLQKRHTDTPCCDSFLQEKVLFRKITLIFFFNLRMEIVREPHHCLAVLFLHSPNPPSWDFFTFALSPLGFIYDKSSVRCSVFPVNSSYGHGLPGVKSYFWALGSLLCSREHSCWETKIGDAIPILKNLTLDHMMPAQKSVKALNGKSPKVPKSP